MSGSRVKVGVIGCGNISGIYLTAGKRLEILEIAACADLDLERARAKAQEHGIPRACTVKELLADPEIQIVVNLTVPKAHAEVDLLALEAGKHVYAEKPFAVTRPDGQKVLEAARAKGLLVGSAPDTFMGAGIQTCRKVLDDGWIGQPLAATARMLCRGHESWHPSPEFYYEAGGGPMLDMGPYYLTALVNLLGPVKSVSAMGRASFPTRTITSQHKYGKVVPVEVPTHLAGVLQFESGALGTIVTSFDVYEPEPLRNNRLEIYGTQGTLCVPDPNSFGGQVMVFRPGSGPKNPLLEAQGQGLEVRVNRPAGGYMEVPHTHIYADNNRGIGVADMAYALRSRRPHRASGALAFHVLDIMIALHEAAASGKQVTLASRCDRPAPLPMGLLPGRLDE